MSAAQLERLQDHLQRLRLFKVRERLEALLQDATAKETPYADFLDWSGIGMGRIVLANRETATRLLMCAVSVAPSARRLP